MRRIYVALFFFVLICVTSLRAQTITTVAGGGPNDLPALDVGVGIPPSVAFDSDGNYYIAAPQQRRIFKVDTTTGKLTVFAGNGSFCLAINSLCGDGGSPTDASFYEPRGVAVDLTGNVYIADPFAGRIRKVDAATKIISTVAGNGTVGSGGDGDFATSASLHNPFGVAVDGAGNLYIADTGNNRIRRVDAGTKMISTVAGVGSPLCPAGPPCTDTVTGTDASLSGPQGVTVLPTVVLPIGDPDGQYGPRIGIADTGHNRIVLVRMLQDSFEQVRIRLLAGNGSPGYSGDDGNPLLATLNRPAGVAYASTDRIYVADTGNNRIRTFFLSGYGVIATVAGNGEFCPPPTNTSGDPNACGDNGSPTLATLNGPAGVALNPASDRLYVADTGNNRIRTFLVYQIMNPSPGVPIITTAAGNGTPAWAGDGGPATEASFVALVAETANYIVTDNRVTVVGVAKDQAGNIYLADSADNRVRKVDAATGIISTVAGSGKQCPMGCAPDQRCGVPACYNGDGVEAIDADLSSPYGVAVDGVGNLYIADTGNNRIRKVDTDGTISTVAGNGIPCPVVCTPEEGCSRPLCYSVDGSLLALDARLDQPNDVAVDGLGNIYITGSMGDYGVLKVDAGSKKITRVAGNGNQCRVDCPGRSCNNDLPCYEGDLDNGNPRLATAASMNKPNDVAVDWAGNLYIAAMMENRIFKVDAEGFISTVAGTGAPCPLVCGDGACSLPTECYSGDGGPAIDAKLSQPNGVAVDGVGNLYIADSLNSRIRKVDALTKNISTVVGTGSLGFSGDGGPATDATLAVPSGVVVDKAGGLLIADSGNGRLRSVGNTPTNKDTPEIPVVVAPADSITGATPVTLTFDTVTQAGNISLTTPTEDPPALPSGFKLGSTPTYYDLTTTALFTGSINICINYSGVSYDNPAELSIWHYDTSLSDWTELATTIDPVNTTACASTPSLSPFAIFEPAYVGLVQPPINPDGSSVFKAKRGVVPVKFTITHGGVATCQLPPATISLGRTVGTAPGPIDESLYLMPSDNGSNFRIDTTDCQYIYNLGAKSLGIGTYRVNISMGGGIVGSGVFGLN